jgi:ABC-type polysaccharide/polyol phosphate export permease
VLIESAWPAGLELAPLFIWTIVMFLVGSVVFRKVEPGFADVL